LAVLLLKKGRQPSGFSKSQASQAQNLLRLNHKALLWLGSGDLSQPPSWSYRLDRTNLVQALFSSSHKRFLSDQNDLVLWLPGERLVL
jgi:hypothetical protein